MDKTEKYGNLLDKLEQLKNSLKGDEAFACVVDEAIMAIIELEA